MLCLVLMDDRIRAIEVESPIEVFLMKIPETDATLLGTTSPQDVSPLLRCVDETTLKPKLSSVSPLSRSKTGSRWPEVLKYAKAKSSLSYDD